MAEQNGASILGFDARALARAASLPIAPKAEPRDTGFESAVFAKLRAATEPASNDAPKPAAPTLTDGVLKRLLAKQEELPAAVAAPPADAVPTTPATAAPAPPAPVDPVLATLTKLADAMALMSAPRVLIRDESGRILRSEVQPVKASK